MWIKINRRFRLNTDKIVDIGIPRDTDDHCIIVSCNNGEEIRYRVENPELTMEYIDRALGINNSIWAE